MEPRERIVRAALEGIDRVGVDGLTVRGIAEAADVNGAAINYYFGTKDRLLKEVLERAGREGLWGTLDELEALIDEGHFPAGSMGPKVDAVAEYLRQGGARALITDAESLDDAIEGRAGTHFIGRI